MRKKNVGGVNLQNYVYAGYMCLEKIREGIAISELIKGRLMGYSFKLLFFPVIFFQFWKFYILH